MTDATRLAALEAVVDAARQARRDGWTAPLYGALDALDALPAQPQPPGEVVEVRAAVIFYSPHDWMVRGEAGWDQKDMEEEARSRGRPLTAILSGRVSYPPTIPTIPARVATGGGS